MFSVIIPLYNKKLSIEDTIKSVLNQSFENFEIIVVNDGSTDDSLSVVNKIKDERIKVFTKKNAGVSSARNYGIDRARYEWIAFLDGDDFWFENHLEEIYKMINLFPDKKLFATSFVKSTEKNINQETKDVIVEIDNYFKTSLVQHLIWTSVFVCKRDCFFLNKFDVRLSLGEDFELFGRLVKLNSLVKSNKVTAIYRIEAENRSNIGKYKMHKSIFSILDFNKMDYPYEKVYYKKLLKQKLKDFLVLGEYECVLFLLKRYNFKIFI